jgi:hypothetical protein
LRIGKTGVVAEEVEAVSLVGGEDPLQEQSPEQARQHALRKKPGRHDTQRSPLLEP